MIQVAGDPFGPLGGLEPATETVLGLFPTNVNEINLIDDSAALQFEMKGVRRGFISLAGGSDEPRTSKIPNAFSPSTSQQHNTMMLIAPPRGSPSPHNALPMSHVSASSPKSSFHYTDHSRDVLPCQIVSTSALMVSPHSRLRRSNRTTMRFLGGFAPLPLGRHLLSTRYSSLPTDQGANDTTRVSYQMCSYCIVPVV
jgi:hypothetical protein